MTRCLIACTFALLFLIVEQPLRAQSWLNRVDTTLVAAGISIPPDTSLNSRSVEVDFAIRIDADGIVDSVGVLDPAQRSTPFGKAISGLVGTRVGGPSLRSGKLAQQRAELRAHFGTDFRNGRHIRRVTVSRLPSAPPPMTYNPASVHSTPSRDTIGVSTRDTSRKSFPPAAAEQYPDSDEFVPVEEEPKCNMNDLARRVKYPEEARRNGIQGTVIVRALISKEGKVVRMLVDLSDSPVLTEAALEAVRNTPFLPAKQGGKPVAMWVQIPVRFALN